MLERELPRAEQRLAECRDLLSFQFERVAKLRDQGITKRESTKLLTILEDAYALHVLHIERLKRDLEQGDYEMPAPYSGPPVEIPAGRAQESFFRLAASWELEARLLERTALCIVESKELIARASKLLSVSTGDNSSGLS